MSMNEITPEMVEAGFRALYKNRGAYIQPQNKANCLAKVERLLTAALAAAPAPQPVAAIVPEHCPAYAFVFEGGCLTVSKDGSGYIVVDEGDFYLEDDRCEGPDGPEGSVHWIARFPAGEMTALRDFLNGQRFTAPPAEIDRLSQDIVLLQNSVRALRKALVQKAKDLRNTDAANKRIREALKWYGEQARLARLITSEGDAGRTAISADGGTRANTALKGGE